MSYNAASIYVTSMIAMSYVAMSYVAMSYVAISYMVMSIYEMSSISFRIYEMSYVSMSIIAMSYVAMSYMVMSYVAMSYIEDSYVEVSSTSNHALWIMHALWGPLTPQGPRPLAGVFFQFWEATAASWRCASSNNFVLGELSERRCASSNQFCASWRCASSDKIQSMCLVRSPTKLVQNSFSIAQRTSSRNLENSCLHEESLDV